MCSIYSHIVLKQSGHAPISLDLPAKENTKALGSKVRLSANRMAGVFKPIEDTTNKETAGMVEIEFHYF